MTEMTSRDGLALVLTTESDGDRARAIAEALIERRLAACVTLRDVRSVYRWDDRVEDGAEVELVVKTTMGGVTMAIAAITELHSYALPEIVVLDAQASASYARWVDSEVD